LSGLDLLSSQDFRLIVAEAIRSSVSTGLVPSCFLNVVGVSVASNLCKFEKYSSRESSTFPLSCIIYLSFLFTSCSLLASWSLTCWHIAFDSSSALVNSPSSKSLYYLRDSSSCAISAPMATLFPFFSAAAWICCCSSSIWLAHLPSAPSNSPRSCASKDWYLVA
jgi:hypothetical protein